MNGNRILHLNPEQGVSSSLASMAKGGPFIYASTSTAADGMLSPCSDCSSEENNSPTALNSFKWDKPDLEDKTVEFAWSPRRRNRDFPSQTNTRSDVSQGKKRPLSNGYVSLKSDSETSDQNEMTALEVDALDHAPEKVEALVQRCSPDLPERDTDRFISEQNRESHPTSFGQDADINKDVRQARLMRTSDTFLMSPPTPTESKESLIARFRKEQEGLRKVPWFQAGIPREIALEVLSGKPVGSFIVRESTTKPGCYALSLRVPPGKNPTGIAHYLILHTNKGYKIKGFMKEFSSLDALITHHSVMPELLPCPLALPRQYKEKEQHSRRDDDMDFVDTEEADRRSLFSDIHWLMNDLEL